MVIGNIHRIINKACRFSSVPSYYKEDAKQEAWVRILMSCGNLADRGLIFQHARYGILDFLRKMSKHEIIKERNLGDTTSFLSSDTSLDIHIFTERLFDDADTVAVARDLCKGKTIREISRKYRISNTTIYKIKHRIKEMLNEDNFRKKRIK
jgi:Mor family transcriptional regulator